MYDLLGSEVDPLFADIGTRVRNLAVREMSGAPLAGGDGRWRQHGAGTCEQRHADGNVELRADPLPDLRLELGSVLQALPPHDGVADREHPERTRTQPSHGARIAQHSCSVGPAINRA